MSKAELTHSIVALIKYSYASSQRRKEKNPLFIQNSIHSQNSMLISANMSQVRLEQTSDMAFDFSLKNRRSLKWK